MMAPATTAKKLTPKERSKKHAANKDLKPNTVRSYGWPWHYLRDLLQEWFPLTDFVEEQEVRGVCHIEIEKHLADSAQPVNDFFHFATPEDLTEARICSSARVFLFFF